MPNCPECERMLVLQNECKACGWLNQQRSNTCSTCNRNVWLKTQDRNWCLNCYEEHLTKNGLYPREIDRDRTEILSAHPEWERKDGEPRSEYVKRMRVEIKRYNSSYLS